MIHKRTREQRTAVVGYRRGGVRLDKTCCVCRAPYVARHSCPKMRHRMPAAGPPVWKDETETRLVQFYVQNICSQRTLFTNAEHNSYLAVLRIPCDGVKDAVCCLASAYLPEPEVEARYVSKVQQYLRTRLDLPLEPLDVCSIIHIIQLMIHYHVVTRYLLSSWPFHSRAVAQIQRSYSVNHGPSLFVTYESILKLTYAKDGEGANDGISIDYLLDCEQLAAIRDFGCSRQLLHALGTINLHEALTRTDKQERTLAGENMLRLSESVEQVALEPHSERRAVIEKIAESYKHVARIIIYCRLYGYVRTTVPLP
ncbi:hypothetical protein VTK56DRAFT_6104 [Thermocarpiscus australiensis]